MRRLHFQKTQGLRAVIFLALLSSCAPQAGAKKSGASEQLNPPTGAVMGTTKVSEVVERLGPPTSQTPSIKAKDVSFVEYKDRPDHLKFQTRAEVVEAEFRQVKLGSPQSTLQYWRHRWRGQRTTFVSVKTNPGAHDLRMKQFSAPDLGAAVIYDVSADRVTQVVRYVR